jgi:leucyl/phenylalanyl-tRNA---protein transferase
MHFKPIPRLAPGDAFPPVDQAWGADDPAPGLLAAGASLSVASLCDAYRHGIFPWYSEGQPILWWSTDPRMVLAPAKFRLHRSLARTLQKFRANPAAELRFDTAFSKVIRACASTPRDTARRRVDQSSTEICSDEQSEPPTGTWIVPDMVNAYEALHHAGLAHSVETWVDGVLVGGLYCVAIGQAVFGESMFSLKSDASKIALSGLVAFCRAHGIGLIDCQQNTRHLASLGASEISRCLFAAHVTQASRLPAPRWQFENVYWNQLVPSAPGTHGRLT